LPTDRPALPPHPDTADAAVRRRMRGAPFTHGRTGAPAGPGPRGLSRYAMLDSHAAKHEAPVGPAESEAVRQDRPQTRLSTLAHDRVPVGLGVERLDVGRAGEQPVTHHQQTVY